MKTAALLTIGSELLKGSVLDTNKYFLGRELTQMGFLISHQISCADTTTGIKDSLQFLMAQSDLVILSGGLGPTPDDVTREALAEYFDVPLQFHKKQYEQMASHYRKRRRKVPRLVEKESYYPENAIPLVNHFGVALGFYIPLGSRLMIVLPGVPAELRNMFFHCVQPLVKKYFPQLNPDPKLMARILGYSEPRIMEVLGKSLMQTPMDFGIYPLGGEVLIQIYAKQRKIIQKLKKQLRKKFGVHLYSFAQESLYEVTARLLTQKRFSISLMESCTGGLLAASFSAIPGASRYLKGAVIAYDNRVKIQSGVSKQILKEKGAVSSEAAKAMAVSIREQMQTSVGIGITGIAGPTGGSPSKPVGTVCIALASAKKTLVVENVFWGDRNQVRERAALKACELLYYFLKKI